MTENEIAQIVQRRVHDRAGLISILEEIQAREGYLSEEALRLVARKVGRSLTDVYAVASFYRAFSLKPRGRHVISVCLGTACHVRGGQAVAEQFSRELGIRVGETTPDREFTLETVNCLGACALGPIVVAEGRYFSKVRPNRVKEILAAVSVAGRQAQEPAVKGKTLTLKAKCPGCGRILTDTGHHIDGEPAIGLRVHAGETTGQLMLSSRYDGGAVRCDSLVSEGTVLRVSCPMCGRTLTDTYCCNECGAPMVAFPLSEGGTLRFCLRWGCKARILDLC